MEKQLKTEEQLKTEIFSLFLQCKDEPSSDRRQVYSGQLCELIFQWCNSYPFQNINAQDIGLEIFKLVLRIIKKNSRQNIPKDENGFFKYLRKALYHANAEYYRTYESDSIKIPKEKMSKLKKIDEIIRMEESSLGRSLTANESVQCLSEWFGISPKEARKYLNLKKMKNIKGFTINSHGNIISKDIYNSEKVKIPYMNNSGTGPEQEFFSIINAGESLNLIKDSIESVLKNTQDKTRDCYRALLTVFCIDNSIELEGLSSVLDTKILEEFNKNLRIPNQHEIYLRYHPHVKKESAGVRASEMLKKLLSDLYIIINEKNN